MICKSCALNDSVRKAEEDLTRAQREYAGATGAAKEAARVRLLAVMDAHAKTARQLCVPTKAVAP